jgi:3-hydroxyacyl-[acyl-carrier-protein] dehydratase
VTPGDQLRIEVEVLSMKTRAGRILGKAFVDGKLACQATLTCQVVPRVREPLPGTTVETADAQEAVAQE